MIRTLLAAAVLISTSLTGVAFANSPRESELEAIRREIFLEGIRDCHPASMTRCWYLFFGSGDAPRRKLWLVDLKDHAASSRGGTVFTDTLQIHESTQTAPDGPQGVYDYYYARHEVDCRKRRVRTRPETFVLGFDSDHGYFGKVGQWASETSLKDTIYDRIFAVSCDKEIRLRPLAYDMAWLGDYPRPIDAVDAVRRYLFEQK